MHYVSLMNIIKPAKFTNVIAAVALSIDSRVHENGLFIWPSWAILNLINRINGNRHKTAVFMQH